MARRLHERFEQLIREVAKFGVVGTIAFIVTEAGTNVLHSGFRMDPLTANAIATVVATCVAFVGNRYWTFRHRPGTGLGRDYALFFLLNGIGLLIQLLCIGFAHYTLGFTDAISLNIALIFGIGLGTLFRFWSYRKWVFLAQGAAATETQEPPAAMPVSAEMPVTLGSEVNGHAAAKNGAVTPGTVTPAAAKPAPLPRRLPPSQRDPGALRPGRRDVL
jgi:putative flippase GtrA